MNNLQGSPKGKVYLVGAGPGEPELITLRGAKILKKSEVVVYDRLANSEILAMTPEHSEHIYVGKKPGRPSVSQQQINRIVISKAQEGKTVVRLKGGDPFIFGRGGEECEALRRAGISYEIVPGLSSVLAAPAYAGIPLTHRRYGRSFTVVTGHTVAGSDHFDNWEHLANADTLIILMGLKNLAVIASTLVQLGKEADTPAAVIENATYQHQRTIIGTLNDIAEKTDHLLPPATIVVGDLVSLSNDLAWFGNDEAENQTIKQDSQLFSNFAG